MTDGPERIWLWEKPNGKKAGGWFATEKTARDWFEAILTSGRRRCAGRPVAFVSADLAAPRVKALVWDDFEGRGAKSAAFGKANYLITKWSTGKFELCESYPGYQGARIGSGFYADIDQAKAAAQADYERRILQALET